MSIDTIGTHMGDHGPIGTGIFCKVHIYSYKHMVPRSGSRRQRNRLHLETVGDIGSGPDRGVVLAAFAPEGAMKALIY